MSDVITDGKSLCRAKSPSHTHLMECHRGAIHAPRSGAAMRTTGGLLAHSLMIIIGMPFEKLALATYAFSHSELIQRVFRRTCVVTFPPSDLIENRTSQKT